MEINVLRGLSTAGSNLQFAHLFVPVPFLVFYFVVIAVIGEGKDGFPGDGRFGNSKFQFFFVLVQALPTQAENFIFQILYHRRFVGRIPQKKVYTSPSISTLSQNQRMRQEGVVRN